MRILFVGDVVGRAGRTAISEHLPGMIRDWALDLVVVNGVDRGADLDPFLLIRFFLLPDVDLHDSRAREAGFVLLHE